jgi:hypothetical protein
LGANPGIDEGVAAALSGCDVKETMPNSAIITIAPKRHPFLKDVIKWMTFLHFVYGYST